jgi:hypothetical protein
MIHRFAFLAMAVATVAWAPGDVRAHAALDAQSNPFRSDFNRDRDKVRVVMLVSPTCPECLHGASVVEGTLFARNASPKLAGYAVWVPKLGAHESDVPAGTALAADPRIRHYWDADERLGTFYETKLPTPGTQSWDVYMIFPPGVVWTGDVPPKPAIWMHQLQHSNPSLFLDPNKFAAAADNMLGRAKYDKWRDSDLRR